MTNLQWACGCIVSGGKRLVWTDVEILGKQMCDNLKLTYSADVNAVKKPRGVKKNG